MFGAVGDKTAALQAVSQVAKGDPTPVVKEEGAMEVETEGEEFNDHSSGPQVHIANTPFGGKMLRSLIAGGRFDNKAKKIVPVTPALNFADILYPVIQPFITEWATGSSSFVVLSLLESENFSKKEEVKAILKKNKKALQKAATEQTAEQKAKAAEIAAAAAEPEVKGKKGKKKVAPVKNVGNSGSKMLLAMI